MHDEPRERGERETTIWYAVTTDATALTSRQSNALALLARAVKRLIVAVNKQTNPTETLTPCALVVDGDISNPQEVDLTSSRPTLVSIGLKRTGRWLVSFQIETIGSVARFNCQLKRGSVARLRFNCVETNVAGRSIPIETRTSFVQFNWKRTTPAVVSIGIETTRPLAPFLIPKRTHLLVVVRTGERTSFVSIETNKQTVGNERSNERYKGKSGGVGGRWKHRTPKREKSIDKQPKEQAIKKARRMESKPREAKQLKQKQASNAERGRTIWDQLKMKRRFSCFIVFYFKFWNSVRRDRYSGFQNILYSE